MIEVEEMTLMFRGLSDEDVKDDEETPEVGGGFDDKKPKPGVGDEEALPEEESLDALADEDDKDDFDMGSGEAEE